MNLSELAFFCHCYSNITRYDKAYLHFLNSVNSKPDLGNENDRLEILAWLNKFGCRQFAKKYHSEASKSISIWYDNYCGKINSIPNNILELKDDNYRIIKEFYEALMDSFASKQNRNGNTVTISFGATGTAKFLFTIKPNTFAPWDDAIRKKFKYHGSAESYEQYLRNVVDNINKLKNICKEKGFSLESLPTIVNRPNSSLPKIIDEYFWMKYTQDAKPPDKNMLNNWLEWLE